MLVSLCVCVFFLW